jgi:hypothetical protein
MLQEQESLLHRIGKSMRAQSEDIAHEPLPKRWVDLIHYLDEQERKRAEGLEAKKEPRDRQ